MLKSQRTNTFDILGNMMAHYDEEDRDEISTGEWVASTILAHLPLIGIINIALLGIRRRHIAHQSQLGKSAAYFSSIPIGFSCRIFPRPICNLAALNTTLPYLALSARIISFSANRSLPPQKRKNNWQKPLKAACTLENQSAGCFTRSN